MLFTFILTVSSVYADNNNTYSSNQTYNVKSVVNYNKDIVDNSEQYELTINKDSNMTNTHVELLPDNDGKYWIPKGYKVKVTADCKDGYTQSNNAIQTVNDTTTINLTSTEASPSRIDELEARINELETIQINTNNTIQNMAQAIQTQKDKLGKTIYDYQTSTASRTRYEHTFAEIGATEPGLYYMNYPAHRVPR